MYVGISQKWHYLIIIFCINPNFTKKKSKKKGTIIFSSFPTKCAHFFKKSMSVVVILCDFYIVFQIDGSYLFRPKSHQKALKKLIQLIQQFLQSHLMSKYSCPGASLAVEKEKNVGEVFFKRVLIFFQDGDSNV